MSDRKIRIAVLQFAHETVSFLPNETTLDDFIYPGSPASGEALLRSDPRNYMGGFVKAAREFSEVELVGIESPPVRVQGTIMAAVEGHEQFWVCVRFGRNNLLILSTYLVQIMEPFSLKALGLDIAAFEVMAIKSRVHFRRGFDDNGFARTILLVEPEQPFLGTTRLDQLPYRNVDLAKFYPYGNPTFSV